MALGNKEITVGRRADKSREIKAVRIELDLEASRRLRQHALRSPDDLRAVVHGYGCIGFRQVRHRDFVDGARLLSAIVSKGAGSCRSLIHLATRNVSHLRREKGCCQGGHNHGSEKRSLHFCLAPYLLFRLFAYFAHLVTKSE